MKFLILAVLTAQFEGAVPAAGAQLEDRRFEAPAGTGPATEQAPSAEKNWKFGAVFSYSSGKYGGPSPIRTTYVPFTLTRLFERGDLAVTVPFVSVRTEGETSLVNGNPQRIKKKGTGTPSARGGLGDIIVKGRWYAVEERGLLPTLDLFAKVKLPTADESEGLGTGKADAGGGVEISRQFLENWVGYLDASYTHIGSPVGTDLKPQKAWDAGLGYFFQPDLLAGVFYEERTALVEGEPKYRTLELWGDYKVDPDSRLNASLGAGLTEGSPDYFFSIGGNVRFGADPGL